MQRFEGISTRDSEIPETERRNEPPATNYGRTNRPIDAILHREDFSIRRAARESIAIVPRVEVSHKMKVNVLRCLITRQAFVKRHREEGAERLMVSRRLVVDVTGKLLKGDARESGGRRSGGFSRAKSEGSSFEQLLPRRRCADWKISCRGGFSSTGGLDACTAEWGYKLDNQSGECSLFDGSEERLIIWTFY